MAGLAQSAIKRLYFERMVAGSIPRAGAVLKVFKITEKRRYYLCPVACENSRHFRPPSLVSPRKDFRETSAEIQYWRRVTTQIWVVMLPGWEFASINQKHYPDLGSVSDVISRKPVLDSAVFSGYFALEMARISYGTWWPRVAAIPSLVGDVK